jgi:magnesium transporter
MKSSMKKKTSKAGLPPGTLLYVGEKKTEKTTISVLDYDPKGIEEKTLARIEDAFGFKSKDSVSWINIVGIQDVQVIEKLGHHFDIHPLVLEDILHTDQRPKYEEYDQYIFIIVNMLWYDEKTNQVIPEQVSFILTDSCVISFQEIEGDVFQPVRERIRNGKGRIRMRGADYLLYALIDAIVDQYFIILEKIGEHIELIEEDVIHDPEPTVIQVIYRLKREIIYLRKSIWPLREVISNLQKQASPLIKETTDLFLRDVYDHAIQIMDTVETYRDMVSGLLDMYMSSVSNKMNEVMKVLTIFAAIFIPLTFIAGVYGMNFQYMPELSIPWAYHLVLLAMVAVGVMLLVFFKHKKWL